MWGNVIWVNGGYSPNWQNGSGASFLSDKSTHQKGESVKLKWNWSGALILRPSSVYLYPDFARNPALSQRDTTTGALLANTDHTAQISYPVAGQYQPMIELRGAGYNPATPSTYFRFYLGGKSVVNPLYVLTVTDEYFSLSATASHDGIFGLDPATFAFSLGDNQNAFVAFAQSIINQVMQEIGRAHV